LKDKANPFETLPRNTKTSAKPKEIPVKAKEIPKFNKMPKIELKPVIPAPKKKKIEEVVTKKKQIIDDDDIETFEEDIPVMKKSRSNLLKQVFSDENSFDSYSEEAFEDMSFSRKEKTPHRYERMSAVPKPVLSSLSYPVQAMPSQKMISNEVPVLIKSSSQMTVELFHAVQLIFNDREEPAVQVIEIHQPNPNPFAVINL
jgi:hypothetical protein